eukprot:gene23491-biopygen8663
MGDQSARITVRAGSGASIPARFQSRTPSREKGSSQAGHCYGEIDERGTDEKDFQSTEHVGWCFIQNLIKGEIGQVQGIILPKLRMPACAP